MNVKGENAATAKQFKYSPCYDTIKTEILNWSHGSMNCIVQTAVQFQRGQIPTVQNVLRVTNPARQSGAGLCTGPEPNLTEPLFNTTNAGKLLGHVVKTMLTTMFSRVVPKTILPLPACKYCNSHLCST